MTSTGFEELPPELLALATDDELDVYIAGLEAEIVSMEKDWRLQARQQTAEDLLTGLDPTKSHELLFGGAVGGGKTDFMLWHLYHLALKYPGFSGLMLRRTYKQLARTVIKRSFQTFDRHYAKWNGVDKTWRFTNGSTIEFGYVDHDQDIYNYDSAEYAVVAWDELTQWAKPDDYLYLFSRIRIRSDLAERGLVGHMIAGTNPGRVGGAWVKARFVDVGDPMQVMEVKDDTSGLISTRVFVPSKLDDNAHISKRQYRANLAALPAKKRKQLEDGDWDVIEGQYFDEWDRVLHVMAPFEIPTYWPRVRGVDFGYTNPMAVVWAAFDPDGVCYIYRELYGTGMVPTVQARRVNELTLPGETVDYTVADPSIWTRTGAGPPIAEQYARAGLRTRKANNARIDGWMRVREYLRVDEVTGLPRLRVFNHCLNLIRTLPMLVHDNTNPEDLDTTGEDHLADCLAQGTRVTTRRGDVPIEDVRVGDEVLNSVGWQRVSDHWLVHADADVMRVVTSDGSITIATPSHRFWTEEHGWVSAGALRYGDTLVRWDSESIPSDSTGSRSGATPTVMTVRPPSTSSPTGDTGFAASDASTKRSTGTTTVRSRPASTSTTSTRTLSTTIRRILRRYLDRNTSPVTCEGVESTPIITDGWWHSPLSGIAALPDARGTSNTRERFGLSASRRSERVTSAAPSTTRSPIAVGSAPTTASRSGGARNDSTSSRSPARGVVSRSSPTGTTTPPVAPVSVVSVIADHQRRPVYDLTVDGEPEFFANGILVHNSLRYLLLSRPRASRPARVEAASLDQRHFENVKRRRHDRSKQSMAHPELGSW